jgi:hypothetical protein
MRALIIISTFLFACSASATTISFDELDGGSEIEWHSYSSGGFDFYTADVLVLSGYPSGFLGWGSLDPIEVKSSNGASFSLQSIDLAWPETNLYSITGYLAGGGTLQQSAMVGTDWATITFSADWQNLDRVVIDATHYGDLPRLDNVVVNNVIPIPAAVWLFASGLGLLGWFRRRTS